MKFIYLDEDYPDNLKREYPSMRYQIINEDTAAVIALAADYDTADGIQRKLNRENPNIIYGSFHL